MKLETLEKMADSGARALDANPRLSRRIAMAAPFLLGGCASLGIEPTKEELAFYERLKSIPRGKVVPITEFPEIMAGVGNALPRVDVEPENHKPPIGIDYSVNPRFPLTPITAPAAGRVGEARFHPEYGPYITMNHGWHYTVGGHMHPILLVTEGQWVDRGTLLGFGLNLGSNAKGIFHYHLGTLRDKFDPSDEPSLEVLNPHFYAEEQRLGTWKGNELDKPYYSELREANNFVNHLVGILPAGIASEVSRRKNLAKKLGYIKNLRDQGALPEPVSNDIMQGDKIERFQSVRPTYTVFANPSRPYLYHVVGGHINNTR